MPSRRDFIKYAGAVAAGVLVDWFYPTDSYCNPESINVNIPEFRLMYRGKRFDVSVGRPNTPEEDTQTPTGKGVICDKLDRPVFRYTKGPKKGRIIEFCETEDGRIVRFPKELMRSLPVWIYTGKRWGWTGRYAIHSTTESWNIGKAVSEGCVRLSIPHMLELFPVVPKNTKIDLRYDTIKLEKDGFMVFPDIYNKGTNTAEALEKRLADVGVRKAEEQKLQNILDNHLGKYIPFSEL
jgi:hypothetical protein